MSLGIPLKILHEAEGHVVTVEAVNNEVFRGTLVEAEDNMNVQLSNVTMTSRDGKTSTLTNIYIRGSKIRFVIMPDMLKNVPMLKMKQGTKGLGSGRGKTTLIRNQISRGRGRGMRGSRGGGFPRRG